MDTNENNLTALANSPMYRKYERAFTELTGLPIALRPVESWQLPFYGKRKENSWCALMAGKTHTCGACLLFQEKLARSAVDQPSTLTCLYGLCESAVPVKLGSKTIGFLQTGQCMSRKPGEASFRRAVEKCENGVPGFDVRGARAAFFKTPVVSGGKMESILRLLAIFADYLSIRSNQIALQTANAEPAVITRARQFIADHQTQELSLGWVAKSVNTGKFHFSRIFKKATGLSYTQYVVRVRIEHAKDLLLNPNLHVSEIAYGSGFQSLTHFNRCFKKLLGQSPTDYRSRLPMAA
jgi:AraC-like DNA-binding protein